MTIMICFVKLKITHQKLISRREREEAASECDGNFWSASAVNENVLAFYSDLNDARVFDCMASISKATSAVVRPS